ncbi:DUF480 domain-containing protein [Nocardioides sp. CBS4Y-1]|uniref:DUF480 domain-containing protein n=1 Tax=Nocardioides acrostichi TaxID=2784339 RepID=A0A930V2Q8_9ACTN|nr:DUF480 domain-containing protein [Nocardioides acrostichi]
MELDALDQRILGSLLEKQVTVPASYPLTLSGLRSACNQTSSREPVSDYDEHTLEHAAKALKDAGLLRIVWSDSGRRTLKYHQVLSDALGLEEHPDRRALLTVLLLRGPQAPGELRSRTDRLHHFAHRDDVETCLSEMAQAGLVRRLARRPGDRDHRWIHLLGDAETEESAPTPAAVDREQPVADSPAARDDRVRGAYDIVAATYTERLVDELDELPFERWLLDRVADDACRERLPVVEVGCGPGHVTAHLHERGADARGLDLSPGMVSEARSRFPDVRYDVGDLRRLMRPEAAPGWGAVLAWYSLIHLAASELPGAVAALARPIAPGGRLVLALHAGTEVRTASSWFDLEIPTLDVVLHEPHEVVRLVEQAGLVEVEWYRRGALAHRGETSERLYLIASKP